MDDLVRQITHLAWTIQRDLEDLSDSPNDSTRSTQSTVDALARIEQKVGAIHGHTSDLVERVPKDLGQTLADLRQSLLQRLDELVGANGSVRSTQASRTGSTDRATQSNQSAESALRSLSPQERRVFQLCFQSGFLSYRDIAAHLQITPTAAKNMVNRLFLSQAKRQLFSKQYSHGAVRVGVPAQLQGRILSGGERRRRKQLAVASVDDGR